MTMPGETKTEINFFVQNLNSKLRCLIIQKRLKDEYFIFNLMTLRRSDFGVKFFPPNPRTISFMNFHRISFVFQEKYLIWLMRTFGDTSNFLI